MRSTRQRLTLLEYGPPVDLLTSVRQAAGIDSVKAHHVIQKAGQRAARNLGLNTNPITTDDDGVRAIDIAGMIRLAPSLELEITPKFLGLDEYHPRWREDFFFLANMSRHGRLLASERLRASGGAPRDLAALVARSLAGMYWENRRNPLRSYRRQYENEFYFDGEIDPFDICLPEPDGFRQEVVRYGRRNQFNASIRGAAKELLPEVSNPEAVSGLVRLIEDLPEQGPPIPTRAKRLPGRSRRWQPVVDLSNDVLRGLGVSFKEGFASAPGYVIRTWRIWEDLLVIAMRLAYGRDVVRSQKEHALGTRYRPILGLTTPLNVYPDLTVASIEGHPPFVIDAKYKTNAEKDRLRVAEADVYEALAFCTATGCDTVILAYPAMPSKENREVGTTTIFERLDVGKRRVYGVQIEVRGISKRSGLKIFSSNLRQGLFSSLQKTSTSS